MDKKTIAALVLIGLVFLLWPVYMRKIVGTPPPVRQETPVIPQQTQEPAVDPGTAARADSRVEPPAERSGARPSIIASTATAGDTIVLETDTFIGRLSSVGGGTIVSWKLKDYYRSTGEEKVWVELLADSAWGNLGLFLGRDLRTAEFDAREETWGEEKRAYFSYDLGDGKRVERTFIARSGTFTIQMEIRLVGFSRNDLGDAYDILWNTGLYPTENRIQDDVYYYQAYALQGGEIMKTKGERKSQTGDTEWVAIRTKYFLVAIVPVSSPGSAAQIEGTKASITYDDQVQDDWKTYQARLSMPYDGTMDFKADFQIYLGPMDYAELRSVGAQLEKMMNFGWVLIRPISIGFFYTFQFLYRLLGNYGLAIIIFSILIKIVLYPLTRKSFQSMKEMQALQPKIAELKEKHGKDPQRLNQETMKLYKQHGVNPMGGCLPLLFQMPVLFALFNLFRTTIMLRQASFLGLIADLSAPDAILPIGQTGVNLLPILMGVTMIFQQRLTSQSAQQKGMAYFMPISLTFIFYRLSAGLNLYYLMFNILTIAQELLIKKKK